MKKRLYLLAALLCCSLSIFQPAELSAVPADPRPVVLQLPDGSTVTVRIHGDEYLSWMTCGNSLVSLKSDGYLYYAAFEADGTLSVSDTRVTGSGPILSGNTRITPPASAVRRALQARSERENYSLPGTRISRSSEITEGKRYFLTILVNFKDVQFSLDDPKTKFHNLLNERGYSENGGTGSAYDYYYDNSNGKFDPSFDVYGPVTLPQDMAYYGENKGGGTNDANPRQMVRDAISAAIEQEGLQLAKYDNDGDGVLDNVFIYYAGHNEAEGGSPDSIWPHKWNSSGTYQGIRIDTYACTSELRGSFGTNMAGIGTFTHEFGHVLGLPDFYDIDYDTDGNARGLGSFSLMSGGNYNNNGCTPPYLNFMERHLLDWAGEPTDLTESGQYTLQPVQENMAFRSPTENEGEYFLYEYRNLEGWDKYLPKGGVLIYHVDQSNNKVGNLTAKQRWNYGNINSYAAHQCFDLVEAVYPESSVSSDAQVPFPGSTQNTDFNSKSSPAAVDWAGNNTGYNLSEITEQGTFTLTVGAGMQVEGTVRDETGNPVAGATVSMGPVNLAGTAPVSATTDNAGKYLLDGPLDDQILAIEANGYLTRTAWLKASKSKTQYDAALKPATVSGSSEIAKFSDIARPAGEPGNTVYAAVCLNADDLTYFGGYGITGVTVSLNPELPASARTSIHIVDRSDNSELYRSESLATDSYADAVAVDLNALPVTLDSSREYLVVCKVEGNTLERPMLADNGPVRNGGALYSTDGTNWREGTDGNLAIRILLSAPVQPSQFPMIYVEKLFYNAGERIPLKLRPSEQTPKSISWEVDGKATAEESVRLDSGTHTIKAILSFEDGSAQTLIQEISVL